MKENYSLCIVDDFTPLLDLCLTEDKLDELIISNQENIPLLQICLKVKYYYISKGLQKIITFPIQNILKKITILNFEHICNIMELSLLVQDIDNVSLSIIKCLQNEICEKIQDQYIYLKLLYTIVNVYYNCNARPPNSLKNLIQYSYREVMKNQSKLVQNLFCKVLIKYEGCADDTSSILSLILSYNDLYTISSCFDIFKKYISIVQTHDFWLMILDNLKSSEYCRKLSLNILKHYINFVNEYDKFNDELDVIKGITNSNTEFLKVWNDYFILMETSQEKSLHLIVPALRLLPKVYSLHPLWIICLYNILLSHSQNSVVYFVADIIIERKLLDNKELFENTIKNLLPALNKYEHSDNFFKLFDKLKQFSVIMEDEYFTILLEESLKVNWGPVPAWYYYSSILCDNSRSKNNLSLLIKIFNHVSKLPHPFVRDNCYHILLKFFTQQDAFNNLSLNEFITIAIDLKRCDAKLLPMFYQHTQKIIEVYNENNVLNEIHNIAFIEFEEVEILLEITNYNTEICTAIESVYFDIINPEIVDQLTSCMYKFNLEMPHITEYLNEKLQTLDNRINLRALSNIANCAKLTDLHLSRCKELLVSQYSTKYQDANVIFAFMLYGNNIVNIIDKDTYHIIKIWSEKLHNREKIQNEICKCYIKISAEYLNSDDCTNDEMFEIVYSTIISIFDTQTEDVWLIIFENIEILKGAFSRHPSKDINKLIFLIFDKLLSEVINFKNTENLTKAWLHLIKTILQDQVIFDNDDAKNILIDKICQTSLLNDTVAYIFINELLNAPNKNLLLFIDLIISLLLSGGVYKKDKRCEFYACRNIDKTLKLRNKSNPNYIHANIRTVAINCIFRILRNNGEDITDSIARICIQRYRKHFKKRYFPDSEVHYSKLRIVQILLSAKAYLSTECKISIIDLIIESFCEESHQPCVKYLMQWLLVLLIRDLPKHVDKIVNKMHIVNRNQVSTIGAFAPVLCHVGLGESQEFLDILIQIMLDWTMGAHFKLRVYSQVAICKLIEAATEKGYTKIVIKYEILYKSIQKVLQMAGANVDNVLQTDKVFLYHFDVNKYYNLHSIFVDIPKLNKVPVTEWECIDLDLFSFNHVPVSGNVINIEDSPNKRNNPDDIIVDYLVNNLQKKILPDYDLMVRDESKTKHHQELILIATLVNSAANLGGIARTCEIYGVKQLVVSDRKVLTSKEFISLSMTSENWVDILEVKQDNLEEYLEDVKKTGYITIGLEQTAESISLHNYRFPKKCVLVLGNEKEGIPSRIFPFLDVCLEIPQFGLLRSLNVHVAGAITIWEYVKQTTLL